MPVPLLDLKAQHATIRDEVVTAMMDVVDSQLFILGAPVERLERSVAELSHTKYAIGCANGTDALLLALRALDCGRGDEVITSPFTFFATAGTIHNVGAKQYFHDEVGFNSRLDALQAAVLQAKLPHLEAWSAKRRSNAAYYDRAFADVPEIRTPALDPANESIYNQYTIRAERRDDLQ